jgi:hypothetical protein
VLAICNCRSTPVGNPGVRFAKRIIPKRPLSGVRSSRQGLFTPRFKVLEVAILRRPITQHEGHDHLTVDQYLRTGHGQRDAMALVMTA